MYKCQFNVNLAPLLWDALRHSRNCIALKAANKVYPDKNRLQKEKAGKPGSLARHTSEADRWRWHSLNALRDLDSVERGAANVLALEATSRTGQEYAGGCFEYAALAYRYLVGRADELSKLAGRKVRLIFAFIPPPGDHAFVIVDASVSPLPMSLYIKDLHEDAMICDPWGNIVSPAHDFSFEWRKKMHKWSNRGLHIDIDRGPIDAIRFANIIDVQPASFYDSHYC